MGHEEFNKLWKGFFYCFWLSDKTDGQHKLAEIIAKFIFQLPADNKSNVADSSAFLFIRTFWETMGREWPNLDHLRLSKYYYFMGRFLFESLNFIASKSLENSEWSADLVKAHNSILSSTVFDFKNLAFPMSIRAYAIEHYFAIVKSVREEPFSADMTLLVCEPIIAAVAFCDNKTFFSQFSEALIQGILPSGEDEEFLEDDGEGEEIESEDEDEEELDDEDDEEGLEDEDEEELENGNDFEEYEKDVLKNDSEDELEDEEFEEDDEEMQSDCESLSDYSPSLFDYSKLGKFIFEFGERQEVLVRNRRVLFDLSKIIDQINSGEVDCCSGEACCAADDSEACH